jgi:IMP dehydrogenase
LPDIDIGLGKTARRAWALDDIAIVPSRRARAQEAIDLSWQVDAYRLNTPVLVEPSDALVSPASAQRITALGGLGVLHLEGAWTRHEDPSNTLQEISRLSEVAEVRARLTELYSSPVQPDLIKARIAEMRGEDETDRVAVAVSPQRLLEFADAIGGADPDLLVVAAPTVSAQYVSDEEDSLDLKAFVRTVQTPVVIGDCASNLAALHLMRTGAAAVLVGSAVSRRRYGVDVPLASAIADVRAARMRHLDETGVYVHIVAHGDIRTGGDIAKAVACGADAVMLGEALGSASDIPVPGWYWPGTAQSDGVDRDAVVGADPGGSLADILGDHGDESMPGNRLGEDLMGALRASMAMTGYETLKELQKADLVVRLQPSNEM